MLSESLPDEASAPLGEEMLGALEALGGTAGNGKLRELLGWDESTYEAVKAALISSRQLLPGRGRGGSVLTDGHISPETVMRPPSVL